MTVAEEAEAEDTAVAEEASAINATGLDILPANAGRKKTVATSVTELDILRGTVVRKRTPATIVTRLDILSKIVQMLELKPATSAEELDTFSESVHQNNSESWRPWSQRHFITTV